MTHEHLHHAFHFPKVSRCKYLIEVNNSIQRRIQSHKRNRLKEYLNGPLELDQILSNICKLPRWGKGYATKTKTRWFGERKYRKFIGLKYEIPKIFAGGMVTITE